MNFVNQKLDRLGLSVQNLDTQVGTQLQGVQTGKGCGNRAGERAPLGTGSLGPPLRGLGVSPLGGWGSSSPMGVLLAGSLTSQQGLLGCFTKGFIYVVVTSFQ